ncbi:hypothetical protein XA68_16343 [Ophiocordyceps unilateralis]|uniref:adenine phosphoribosyltransferase n=1 Tax=Ophiocordyceps unilateralis TaxID=268505 RepID=A0A2A9P6R1_OPHUN|nr:hypothetical protein XA68_16343 [Ophiocordyceps unilateralis]
MTDPSADTSASHHGPRRQPASASTTASQLAGAKMRLRQGLRRYPDFPVEGVEFCDIMPLFASPALHAMLLDALEMQIQSCFVDPIPDLIVGLDARGFLFGPALALRLGLGFVAVRKSGKLPGPCVSARYLKEYGGDSFQMQCDAVAEGQNVLIVDDIIATGGSAKAAADLVTQLKGHVLGYLFILEIAGLKGRDKLEGAKTAILLEDA